MSRSLEAFRADLRQVREMLDRDGAPVFSGAEATELRREAAALSRKLDELSDSVLSVGLLGGTGVGKSSLMNGLAGSEIASASHRRPHTDRVLVYRHRSTSLASPVLHSAVPWVEHVHDAEGVRQVILCDLPDFDSLVGLHRRHVMDFLENLDLLVWVVSPEKYADERLHSFLAEAPKASGNYVFVMNKVDQLFGAAPLEVGYDRLSRMAQTFHRQLVERGIERPVIYTLSALEALGGGEPAPWSQFNAFRHHVFHERDTKEVAAIKTANLDQELESILTVMDQKAIQAGKLRRILEELASEFVRDRAEWARTGREAFDDWTESQVRGCVRARIRHGIQEPGAGSLVRSFMRRLEEDGATTAEQASLKVSLSRDGILGQLVEQWTRMENRVVHRALREGVPQSLLEPVQAMFDPEERWNRWSRSLATLIDAGLAHVQLFSPGGRRWIEPGAYSLLTALLLAGIGLHSLGVVAPHETGWRAGLLWLGAATRMLFSAEGLSALASYGLLRLMLGIRFHASRKKRLQRLEQKIIEALKSDLGRVWDTELDAAISRLQDHRRDLEREEEGISRLRQRRGRG
jgi:hypothetical protein